MGARIRALVYRSRTHSFTSSIYCMYIQCIQNELYKKKTTGNRIHHRTFTPPTFNLLSLLLGPYIHIYKIQTIYYYYCYRYNIYYGILHGVRIRRLIVEGDSTDLFQNSFERKKIVSRTTPRFVSLKKNLLVELTDLIFSNNHSDIKCKKIH